MCSSDLRRLSLWLWLGLFAVGFVLTAVLFLSVRTRTHNNLIFSVSETDDDDKYTRHRYEQSTSYLQARYLAALQVHTPLKLAPGPILPPSVVTLQLSQGGLGDQLYWYAFGWTVARDLDTTLYVVVPRGMTNSSRHFGTRDRVFALDQLRLNSERVRFVEESVLDAVPEDVRAYVHELGLWRPHELPRNKVVILSDYWQSDSYFGRYRTELMTQLVPRESVHVSTRPWLRSLVKDITRGSESVAVHIRRGDFKSADTSSSTYREIGRAHV